MKPRVVIPILLALLAAGGGVAYYVYKQETEPIEKRGSAKEEFEAREKRARADEVTPWPTYAFDTQRRHLAGGYRHRPPYKRLWRVSAGDTIEFPPSVGYGRVYIAQQRGVFLAVSSKTGKLRWKKEFRRCAASSPTIDARRRVVYQAYMHQVPCAQGAPGADGFLIAMDADTGKEVWRFRVGGPVESSPLLVGGRLYFGSWDHKVYALDAHTGKQVWSYEADDQVNTSAAYDGGSVFIATDGGRLYALDAGSGEERWRADADSEFGSREFFYATPTVAYGRVYIGNTDGTMYAYGAKSGELRWARPIGSYVYAAAAAHRKTIYVGTYDGALYALDAATGDVKWKHEAAGAIHSAPTVMDGLVYYATCSSCGSAAKRAVKRGPNGTYAVDARSGDLVWKSSQGKYASPIVADQKRAYLVGRSRVYALGERKRRR